MSRYDSDNPRVTGDVGMAGVAIDSVEDMKVCCYSLVSFSTLTLTPSPFQLYLTAPLPLTPSSSPYQPLHLSPPSTRTLTPTTLTSQPL